MNRVNLTGRLTADPQLRYTQNGTAVVGFTVAVDNPFKKDSASFIECVAWQKTAEFIANKVNKGCRVGVDGRLETENYEDKDGIKRKSTKVVCDQFDVIDWAKEKESDNTGSRGDDDFDSIPF